MRPVVGSTVVMVVAISATVIIVARGSGFEFLVLLLDIGNQVFAKFFGLGNHIWVRSSGRNVNNASQSGKEVQYEYIRDMKEHVLIAFTICGSFQIT